MPSERVLFEPRSIAFIFTRPEKEGVIDIVDAVASVVVAFVCADKSWLYTRLRGMMPLMPCQLLTTEFIWMTDTDPEP